MNIQRNLCLLICNLICYSSFFAQFKFNTAGLVSNRGGGTDKAFYSKQTGTAVLINAAFYFGRIGIGAKGVITKHDVGYEKPPKVDSFSATSITGGGQTANTIAFGPEICLCKSNIKITPSIKFGITKAKVTDTRVSVVAQGVERIIETKPQNGINFTTNPSVTLAYKFSKKWGISVNLDHLVYSIPYQLSDFRINAGQFQKKEVKRNITNIGLGVYANL